MSNLASIVGTQRTGIAVVAHCEQLCIKFNKQTDIILLDLSKAFDKVSHRCLKLKLEYYGIRHKALQWTSSFLNQRT